MTIIQSRAEQSRAEQSRAEQSRAEQSRAEQSRAEQSVKFCLILLGELGEQARQHSNAACQFIWTLCNAKKLSCQRNVVFFYKLSGAVYLLFEANKAPQFIFTLFSFFDDS